MFTARDLHYEIAGRTRGITNGGIGAFHALTRQVGLVEAIDQRLLLLKCHFPYHESHHVLTIASNALYDGSCRQDLELRRHHKVFLTAERIFDPATAGGFCRRFDATAIRQPPPSWSIASTWVSGPGSPPPSSTVSPSTWTASWWRHQAGRKLPQSYTLQSALRRGLIASD